MGTQLGPILDDLERQKHAMDLDRDGFGVDLMDAAVEGMILAMMAEEDPDGVAWPALSDAYADRKAHISPGNPISYLFGLMSDVTQLAGERQVSADAATMTYGTDEQAKQEAVWFQEGNGNQPARPFYAFGPDALRRMDAVADRRFRAAF